MDVGYDSEDTCLDDNICCEYKGVLNQLMKDEKTKMKKAADGGGGILNAAAEADPGQWHAALVSCMFASGRPEVAVMLAGTASPVPRHALIGGALLSECGVGLDTPCATPQA